MHSIEHQLQVLLRGVEECVSADVLLQKLKTGRPLVIKAGFDPTAPDLHLGHAVLLKKLRQFQGFGHKVVFLVGDFTALIGDPTGKNVTRKPLSAAEVAENAKTYADQAAKMLDLDQVSVRFNTEWMNDIAAADWVRLTSSYTVSRMLERDDFDKRFKSQQAIGIHEFLYPLIQGYDSVALCSDVELGGTDQKFNLLMGRTLQKQYGTASDCLADEPQVIMTMPLLEGTDGVRKMSKSYQNAIGLTEAPGVMFRKLLSLPDAIMWRYFELLTDRSEDDIVALRARVEAGENPKEIKKILAADVITLLYDHKTALSAEHAAGNQAVLGEIPEDLEEVVVYCGAQEVLPIGAALRLSGLVKNSNAARDALGRGVVYVNGRQVVDVGLELAVSGAYVIQAGKRQIAKVLLKSGQR